MGQLFATITDRNDSAKGDASAPGVEHEAAIGTTGDGVPPLEQPGTWIGRYKLVKVLGEGGMGVVYLAEQASPIRRRVALKVIKPGMDSKQVVARFAAEQQALAVMDHPHVARVFDAGLTGAGRPYFVMEHVEGIPITEHCDQQKLTIGQRLELFMQVCTAVQHAHYKGIIHRDLKPSNILISIKDREILPKIIDFGIAKALAQPLTERTLYTGQGQFIGTPEYMSPEQAGATSQGIDTRTDVYSLGVTLYQQNQAHENQLAQEQHTLAMQQAQANLLAAERSYASGQYQQALTEVDRSLENLPDPLHGTLIKAHTLHALGRTDEAVVLLRQLEIEHSDEGSVYELLAMIHVAKGQ